jgi:hypothetical protein
MYCCREKHSDYDEYESGNIAANFAEPIKKEILYSR